MDEVNAPALAEAIDDLMRGFGVDRENFLLLNYDAAAYMIACGNILCTMYPYLHHLTCLCLLLHNAAMQIKAYYDGVNDLIASVKAVIVENRTRAQMFADVSNPPEPAVTRWGTWIIAACRYVQNFLSIKEFVLNFGGEGALVTKAILVVSKPRIESELATLQNFGGFSLLIADLESDSCAQMEGYRKILQFIEHLDLEVDFVKQYVESRQSKKPDLQTVVTSSGTLTPADYALLQNSPTSNAAIEQSFSKLRKLLQNDRSSADKNRAFYVAPYVNDE